MPRLVKSFTFVLLIAFSISVAVADETIRFRAGANGDARTVVGESLVEAQDGGVLLQANDGRIWTIQPDQILERKTDADAFQAVSADEMQTRLLKEMPGFEIHRTAHYLVLHNTEEAYAKQVSTLFERLYRGFFTYWKNQGWDLPEPRFPLVALVFANKQSFLKYARSEVGDSADSVIGYYHLGSNRMTTFKMPNLERSIATIIHEATHQLSYNCGVQTRYADNPMWVSEGMATFFEAPDFRNPRGWRTIGRVNKVNLDRWRKYVPVRPGESLATLLTDDSRFRNGSTATEAYAESWALTYFLLKTRRKEYVEFLRTLSEGKPLAERTARERIQVFEESFGTTLVELDKAFVGYMRRVR